MHLAPILRVRPTSTQLRWLIFITVAILLLLAAGYSYAQAAPAPGSTFQVLDSIQNNFMSKKVTWSTTVTKYATRLFFLLATIDFCYLAATFVLDKKELDDMMFSVLRKLMTLGFFFTVLKTSNEWIPQIIDSFTQIGKEAGGATAASGSPDGIVAVGFNAAIGVFQILGELGLDEALVAVLPAAVMALVLFMAFLWVAAQLMIAQIETAFAVGVGVIMLGFGGSKWTVDMASKYMQYAIATGLKLMMLYVVIGVGQSLFSDLKLVSGDMFIPSLIVACGTALMYAFLSTKVPAMASAMMSGSPSLTAGDMAGAVIGAGAAIAGLGAAGYAATKVAGSAATGGAAGATGVAKALGAGMQSGLDLGKSGAGLAAHALGEVGSHGLGMARNAIGDGVSSGRASFAQMVDQSTGGRVASSINASRGGSMAGVAAPAPGAPSSVSGGSAGATSGASSAGGSGAAQAADTIPSSTTGGAQEAVPDSARTLNSAGSSDLAAGDSAAARPHGIAASGSPETAGTGSESGGGQAASIPAVQTSPISAVPPNANQDGDGSATQAARRGAQASSNAASAAGEAAATQALGDTGAPRTAGSATAGAAQAAASQGSQVGNAGGPGAVAASAGQNGAQMLASGRATAAGPTSAAPGVAADRTTTDPLTALAGADVSGSTGSAPMGDASTGAVTGGGKQNSPASGGGHRPDRLHERIKGLQGYVPDDSAQAATVHIDLKHSE